MRTTSLACALLLMLAGCSNNRSEPTSAPAPTSAATSSIPSPNGTPQAIAERVQVAFGEDVVDAEVADEPDEQRTGLMFRRSLDEDAGMLFVFPSDHQGAFWMKNTLIPLQIAYMRLTGPDRYEVVTIRDMEPCTTPSCPGYPPSAPYRAALEVNANWFDRAGIKVGSEAIVRR